MPRKRTMSCMLCYVTSGEAADAEDEDDELWTVRAVGR